MAAEEWKPTIPMAGFIERDLAADPLPFLTESWIQASATPADQRTPEQQQALALSDALIEELLAADVIVLGVPMHNFSIPASSESLDRSDHPSRARPSATARRGRRG